jgi:hypothetical protein
MHGDAMGTCSFTETHCLVSCVLAVVQIGELSGQTECSRRVTMECASHCQAMQSEVFTMVTGGCFCGAMRYEVRAELCRARACHCSKCRKVFSGAGSAYAEIDDPAAFRWTTNQQALSRYSAMTDWEIGFCSRCGSTLCGIHQGVVHGVALGSVDGDPGVEIEMHLFVGSKAPWDHIGGDAPQHEEMPAD